MPLPPSLLVMLLVVDATGFVSCIELGLLSSPSYFLPLLGLHAHPETRPLPDLGDPPLLTVGSKGLQLLLHVMPPGGVQPGHEPCQGASPQRHQQPRFEYHCTLHQGT